MDQTKLQVMVVLELLQLLQVHLLLVLAVAEVGVLMVQL
jgi:hypothetical protein